MRNVTCLLCLLVVVFAVGAVAGDSTKADDSTMAEGMQGHDGPEGMGEMPPMGPPAEMKEIAFLAGEWVVVGKMKMMPNQPDWTDYTGSCTYELIADGAGMYSEYVSNSEVMGMTFKGAGIQTYDRAKKQWQFNWLDNMSGRQTMYTGTRDQNGTVSTGMDLWGGHTTLTRITTWDETPTSFKWMLEQSMDDGKTFWKSMEATYSKK